MARHLAEIPDHGAQKRKSQSHFLEEVETFHNAIQAGVQNDAASSYTHVILALLVVLCNKEEINYKRKWLG